LHLVVAWAVMRAIGLVGQDVFNSVSCEFLEVLGLSKDQWSTGSSEGRADDRQFICDTGRGAGQLTTRRTKRPQLAAGDCGIPGAKECRADARLMKGFNATAATSNETARVGSASISATVQSPAILSLSRQVRPVTPATALFSSKCGRDSRVIARMS
jgi:hypothetical protein